MPLRYSDLAAEFEAMGAVLPGHVVGEDVAAREAALRRIGLIAEGDAGAFDQHVRPAEAQTVRALSPRWAGCCGCSRTYWSSGIR